MGEVESCAWDASSESSGDDSEDEGDGDNADVPNPAMIFIRILLNLVFCKFVGRHLLCILNLKPAQKR